ncbi:hypothetical protein JCM10908_004973 [Rhodotorula pacifica]|uniref:Pho80p n=1 Tax=Rhodotorula pacifica TaxID=1495444 RepID=UPI00317504AF
MSAADPTNANAVPGPSRLVYGATAATSLPSAAPSRPAASSSTAAAATSMSAHPARGKAAAGQSASNGTSQPRKDPVRRADGPVIVPTRVEADNVRVVPQQFENCQLDDLITLIASMLDRLIEHNDRIPLTSNSLTRFHSRAPPNITVRDYLLRIAKYTNVEPCCLLILLPYVDKACARITSFTISSLTVHRFIIAAISVGSKALSDAFCTNGRYARVGGISVVEMNLLEKEFCEALDWRLTTSGPVLAHYYTSLVRSHPTYRLSTAPPPSPPPPAPVEIPAPLPISTTSSTSTPPSPPVRKTSATLNPQQQPPPEPHPHAMDVDTPPPSARATAGLGAPTPSASDGDPSPNGGGHSSRSGFSSWASDGGGASDSSPAYAAPSTSSSGPSPHPHSSSSTWTPTREPPLFPPNLARHISGTGSNLPSPARGAEHTPPPIEGQGSGAGAAGGTSSLANGPPSLVGGLRYLETVGAEAAPLGMKRAHDRLTDGSRSRSRERGGGGTGPNTGGVNGAYGSERVGSPLAAHAGASVRLSDQARLGKSPRLAYAASSSSSSPLADQ